MSKIKVKSDEYHYYLLTSAWKGDNINKSPHGEEIKRTEGRRIIEKPE